MKMVVKLNNEVLVEFNSPHWLYLKQDKDVIGPFSVDDLSELISALRVIEKGLLKENRHD